MRRRWVTHTVLTLASMAAGLQNTITNIGLPAIQKHFGARQADLTWVASSYVLVFAALLIPAGSLGDRYGRRRCLRIGLTVFLLGSIGASLAPSIGLLIGAQCIMAVGSSIYMPTTLGIIMNVFPQRELQRAVGQWAALSGIGVGMGPMIGGLLLETSSYKSLYYVTMPIVIGVFLMTFAVIRESKDEKASPTDYLGGLLCLSFLATLMYFLIAGSADGWTATNAIASLVVFCVTLVAWVVWERKTRYPMLDLALFRNKNFVGGVLTLIAHSFILFPLLYYSTLFQQVVQLRSSLNAGLVSIPATAGLFAGSVLAINIAPKIGNRKTIMWSFAFAITGTIFVSVWTRTETVSSIIDSLMVTLFGSGLGSAPATSLIMCAVPPGNAGLGSAVSASVRQIGGSLGIAVLTAMQSSLYQAKVGSWFSSTLPSLAHNFTDTGTCESRAKDGLPIALGLLGKCFPGNGAVQLSFYDAVNDGWVEGMFASLLFGIGLVVVCALVAFLALTLTKGRLFFDQSDHVSYRKTPESRASHWSYLAHTHMQSIFHHHHRKRGGTAGTSGATSPSPAPPSLLHASTSLASVFPSPSPSPAPLQEVAVVINSDNNNNSGGGSGGKRVISLV